MESIIRFVLGGLLVAGLPKLVTYFGPRITGLFLVFPLVVLIGLVVLGASYGSGAMGAGAIGALKGLLALGSFLVIVGMLAKQGLSWWIVLLSGLVGWGLVAIIMLTSGWIR